MPFNGSGLFTRNYNWVNDKNAAIPITASRVDADSNDFADGLSSVVTRDGQGPATTKVIVNGVGATGYSGGFVASNAQVLLNKHGNNTSAVSGLREGLGRWALVLGDGTAESGGDSGSNLVLNRYHDAGTLIDSPISINRATGMVTINNLTAGALSAPPSTPTSLALTGSLSVGTTTTLTGITQSNAGDTGIRLNGRYRSFVAGGHAWDFGNIGTTFYITDDSIPAHRLTIDAGGAVNTQGGSLTCGALGAQAFSATTVSCAAITCTTINTQGNGITCGGLQVNGTTGIAAANALLYMTANGVRQWYMEAASNGTFYFVDGSSGIIPWSCAGGTGQLALGYQLNAQGISCAAINTNGNDITCGNGVAYSNHGGHVIGFSNSGLNLTFYALGGSSGSWGFNPSDERFKENIGPPAGDALAELQKLKLISFDLPSGDETPTRHFNCGFSAQDIQSVTPDSISEVTLPDGREQLVLDSLSITARCVGAIQQLAARVEALEAKLASR